MPKSESWRRLESRRCEGEVTVGVQMNIPKMVWDKFKGLCQENSETVSEAVVDLISDYCAEIYTKEDAFNGNKHPKLIGHKEIGSNTGR